MAKVTFTIKKTVGIQEWVVRFHKDGKFMPDWTYYAGDKEDAIATANTTVHWAASFNEQ